MKSSGLRTESLCTPNFTVKASPEEPSMLTAFLQFLCMAMTILIIHSPKPALLRTHLTLFLGCDQRLFQSLWKASYRSLLLARNFSCTWWMRKIASIVPFPSIKPKCTSSQMCCFSTTSKSFMLYQTASDPCNFLSQGHHPSLCSSSWLYSCPSQKGFFSLQWWCWKLGDEGFPQRPSASQPWHLSTQQSNHDSSQIERRWQISQWFVESPGIRRSQSGWSSCQGNSTLRSLS